MIPTFKVPATIRGQVLQQGQGYLVRGQYVLGRVEKGWFWYDVYNRSHAAYDLLSVQAAFDNLATFLKGGAK